MLYACKFKMNQHRNDSPFMLAHLAQTISEAIAVHNAELFRANSPQCESDSGRILVEKESNVFLYGAHVKALEIENNLILQTTLGC